LKESGGDGFWELYREMYKKYAKYNSIYASFADIWSRYHDWFNLHSPSIVQTLQVGCSVEQLAAFEKAQGFELPLQLQCSYLFHNGQASSMPPCHSFFGGYQYYEQGKFLSLIDLERMAILWQRIKTQKNSRPEWIQHACPVAFSSFGKYMCFLLLNDLPGYGKMGEIVVPSEDYQHTFKVADSYYDWLLSHVLKLENGDYEIEANGGISLFPKEGAKEVGIATTREITIVASPIFIPERTNLSTNPPVYFWAYKIRMSMPPDCHQLPSRLSTRHWIITDATGHMEEVRGPGVIGKHPVMKSGANFEYCSCCPLSTPSGSMRGDFQMVCQTGEAFDANVGEFLFLCPPSGSRGDEEGQTSCKKMRHV